MKTFLFCVLLVGATSAQLVIPSLKDLDISNLGGLQILIKQFGSETVLNKAASQFLAKFKDSPFLRDRSSTEILQNFIENAKQFLSQPAKDWQQALDIELLGLSAQQYESLLTLQTPSETEESSSGSSLTSSRSKRQTTKLPSSIDWRTKGAVTGIKNQGQCGSCWSFAGAGALEGRFAVKTGTLPVVSEQNLIDCARNDTGSYVSYGCVGGWITDAYKYAQLNNGINSNATYPYEAKNGDQCRYDSAKSVGISVGFVNVTQNDEDALMRAVAEGPVAAAVDATGMQSYRSGILKCYTQKPLNHGVVIVGYGSDWLFGDYWIVKNSWGASWGEKGFFRMTRNPKYACGLNLRANYPLV
ncbi:unnamed protein product [Orchesella dallaii]|uniref:Peptidase C1A papain C-terminal domain-containing protein n=1 Tax=Orchesella dallaii TaxID=48710 RepID=A0ABP1QXF2_9HEXA